jgi:phosphate/sulfate permease
MKKNSVKIYLAVMTLFSAFVVFSMPVSITTVIFSGIFIVNIFLFLDAFKKD